MQRLEPIYLNRLAALYVLASSIPSDDRFNIESWTKRNEESECGTSACLAGHAALHPHFVAQGFKRAEPGSTTNPRYQACDISYKLTPEQRASPEYKELCASSRDGWDQYMYGLAMFWGFGNEELRCRSQNQIDTLDEPIMMHPFWPTSYVEEDYDGNREPYAPTSAEAAAYVLKYMHYWWPQRDVDAAIEQNQHVTYNPDFVHFYMPWTPSQATVDELAAWKMAIDAGQTTLGASEWIKARREVVKYAGRHVLPGHLVL